jgi:hypothetical protein
LLWPIFHTEYPRVEEVGYYIVTVQDHTTSSRAWGQVDLRIHESIMLAIRVGKRLSLPERSCYTFVGS